MGGIAAKGAYCRPAILARTASPAGSVNMVHFAITLDPQERGVAGGHASLGSAGDEFHGVRDEVFRSGAYAAMTVLQKKKSTENVAGRPMALSPVHFRHDLADLFAGSNQGMGAGFSQVRR